MMEIKVVKQILAWNEDVSRQVQELLAEKKVCMINVMGSPGAGKTSLITRIIESLRENYRIGVIEGDIAGQIDADKIYAMGIPVVQLQTDGACHDGLVQRVRADGRRLYGGLYFFQFYRKRTTSD